MKEPDRASGREHGRSKATCLDWISEVAAGQGPLRTCGPLRPATKTPGPSHPGQCLRPLRPQPCSLPGGLWQKGECHRVKGTGQGQRPQNPCEVFLAKARIPRIVTCVASTALISALQTGGSNFATSPSYTVRWGEGN